MPFAKLCQCLFVSLQLLLMSAPYREDYVFFHIFNCKFILRGGIVSTVAAVCDTSLAAIRIGC